MTQLTKLTIEEALAGLRNKDFSALELTQDYIKNIENNRQINAYITECFDIAIKMAKNSDDKIAANKAGEIEGIPLGIKDLFCTKDIRTTCASKMLENFVPTYESTVTQKLFDAGAINLGKLNMDEFAMGSTNTNSYFGPVINPYKAKDSNEDLVPGGSSGGSAAAVAANLCAGSTGSDTGGSVRQPASFTNIVGVKPTYGRCSRYGMIAFASSLDQAGFFAKSVYDASLLLKVAAGYDKKDSTSCNVAVPDFNNALNLDIKGKKIGVVKEYEIDGMSPAIEKIRQQAISKLKERGAEIVEISLPHSEYGPEVYYIVASAECSSNLARYDGVRYGFRCEDKDVSLEELYKRTRSLGFGNEVKRRIFTGTYVLSAEYYDAYYKKALKVKRLISDDFKKAFAKVDAILTPTTPNTPFPIAHKIGDNPVQIYLNDVFTIPANLAGLPAISVPGGFDEKNLPIGVQLMAKSFDEQTLFDIALALEKDK